MDNTLSSHLHRQAVCRSCTIALYVKDANLHVHMDLDILQTHDCAKYCGSQEAGLSRRVHTFERGRKA